MVLLGLALLLGCASTDLDTGSLIVKRDDVGKITDIRFRQPKAASEASTFTFNVTPEGDINGEAYMGTQYNTRGIAETFRAFRIWHYAGIGLVILGIAIGVLRKNVPGLALVSKKAPRYCIIGGIGCAIIGHVVPAYGTWIVIVGGAIAVAVLLHTLYMNKPAEALPEKN